MIVWIPAFAGMSGEGSMIVWIPAFAGMSGEG